jgi:hypothetical protein
MELRASAEKNVSVKAFVAKKRSLALCGSAVPRALLFE